MQIVESYEIAVLLCFVTMLCWGSWANTQKLASKNWRFELFYWDYVIGIVVLSLLFAFTLGSIGNEGRGFVEDVLQADAGSYGKAVLGGVIFNLANILLVAAISIAGMAVAFPVGIGIALILGVVLNFYQDPTTTTNPIALFVGVGLVALAIILDAVAYGKASSDQKKVTKKGMILSIVAGVLMASFYSFVADSMAPDFANPVAGMLTPYSAIVFFALGILLSNFVFNTIFMRKPVEGEPVSYKEYFSAGFSTHLTGILGGIVWCIGMSLSIVASGAAGTPIAYGLGQGATLVAALWGVFIWKEFKEAPKSVTPLLAAMFVLFLAGIGCVIYAGMPVEEVVTAVINQ